MMTKTAQLLFDIYNSLARTYKRKILWILDLFLFIFSILGAFCLIDLSLLLNINYYILPILLLISIKLLVFRAQGLYRSILRYTGIDFVSTIGQAVLISAAIIVFLGYLGGVWPLPRSVLVVDALLTLFFVASSRILIRNLFKALNQKISSQEKQRLMIYGAGEAGSQLVRSLLYESRYELVGFLDDDEELHHQFVQGLKVFSPKDLSLIYQKYPFDMAILAMTHLSNARRRDIVEHLETLPILVKTVPTLATLMSGEFSVSNFRNIDVTELLGREEVLPDPRLLQTNITNKAVLVTGGGGSIGAELCRQIAQLQPQCLVVYELSEFALYTIEQELHRRFPQLTLFAYLGNITDELHLRQVLRRHRIQTIYHAAAYKHVPIVEANPTLGINNNVKGTLNVAQAAIACDVANMVLISTDKAVRPTNVMGASKRVAELVIQALADLDNHHTCFTCVRFGNVLDSSGSVVPLFRRQIAEGQPLTVTHPEVTRYFMSIPEAVRLVIQAGAMAQGGEVFLLDMGEPIRIYDLAQQMIRLSGLELGRDIDIKITGLRPGEKLYEELLIDTHKAEKTLHPRIFCAQENRFSWSELTPQLEKLLLSSQTHHDQEIRDLLKVLVPEYKPSQSPGEVISTPVNPPNR